MGLNTVEGWVDETKYSNRVCGWRGLNSGVRWEEGTKYCSRVGGWD